MQKITPFLWFDDNAEEAMNFYTSIFEDSAIIAVSRYSDAGPGPVGTVMVGKFRIEGQEFIALNGGPQFSFSQAISFVVDCKTQEEVDYYWERLSEGGEPQMCGWLKDRFGLSWQIVPSALGELMSDPDVERSKRVMQAMLNMTKIDIEGLRSAYDGV